MLELCPLTASEQINQGKVIAYPTEAVYGLGCDPDNDTALEHLLALKKRDWRKGLILVASDYSELRPYIDEAQLTPAQLDFAKGHWPGPFTMIMPIRKGLSQLLCGQFNSIAVRVSAHEGVQALCRQLGKPVVSTSANLSGLAPAMSVAEVQDQFEGDIAGVLAGALGMQESPSTIIDVITGKVLRQG